MRIYENEGKKYLSVTSIIDLMFPFDNSGFALWAYKVGLSPEWINKRSTDLGTRYHEYFENKFNEISDWADIIESEQDQGYRNSVEDFYSKGWEILESEQEVFCDKYHYAGRFDLIVKNERLGIDRAIGDIKSWGAWSGKKYKKNSGKLKKVTTQLNMYNYAIGEPLPKVCIVPQSNGECIIEDIKTDLSFLDWLEDNEDKILKYINEDNTNRA